MLSSTEPAVACTSCGTTATHMQSRSQRRLKDLPVSGHRVQLHVEVRRFFCQNPCCPRKTFAEAFVALARRSAQRTNRLERTLQDPGFALGGEAGARIGALIGLPSSPASLLRLLRQAERPAVPEPATIIGSDDWAYKRRRRSGTLICDLLPGHPLEAVPDRSVQTVRTWVQEHPEITLISRDRWRDYATAAQKGTPQARQVADRWHLLHNLTESVATLFPRIHAELNPSAPTRKQKEPSAAHAARQEQYRELLAFSQQGLKPAQIAALVFSRERTVSRWLTQTNAPSWRHHTRSGSVLDPYRAYVLKRWQQGCQKGAILCRELKAQGYRGSERAVYRYLTHLQAQPWQKGLPLAMVPALSSKRMTWLLVKKPADLDEEERQALSTLRQASVTAETAYHLVQAFGQMVRERQGARLDSWLKAVDDSALPELQAFAAGSQRDKAAVQNGLTFPSSNGLLEGLINRLKLIKGSMYGRANFDLLRQRVLWAS